MAVAYFDPGDKFRRMVGMLDDPAVLLEAVGITMVAASREAFVEQSWDGVAWPKRMTPNWAGIVRDFMEGAAKPRASRLMEGPALMDRGTLFGSLAWERVEKYAILAGSNVEYAGKQQHGLPGEIGPWDATVRERMYQWLKKQTKEVVKDLRWLLSEKWLTKGVELTPSARTFVGMTKEIRSDCEDSIARTIANV